MRSARTEPSFELRHSTSRVTMPWPHSSEHRPQSVSSANVYGATNGAAAACTAYRSEPSPSTSMTVNVTDAAPATAHACGTVHSNVSTCRAAPPPTAVTANTAAVACPIPASATASTTSHDDADDARPATSRLTASPAYNTGGSPASDHERNSTTPALEPAAAMVNCSDSPTATSVGASPPPASPSASPSPLLSKAVTSR
mmetsp:Transcript_127725/g.310562  ORF Transcript_127725/g.310562 Transcript_127725/m.310562 type:complete len:200 (-) Transcript_127725:1271-1870(-)